MPRIRNVKSQTPKAPSGTSSLKTGLHGVQLVNDMYRSGTSSGPLADSLPSDTEENGSALATL